MNEVVQELQEQVQAATSIKVRGGGSKSALSHGANVSTQALRGVLEYQPQEYTLTALAGTPLQEIEALLAEQGQYLPFDPVLLASGATVGGTITSGLSGAGRYRYGGVRDFLLGVRFIAGDGELYTGGGKVIKNASGFDLPKLLVGSCGKYGVITEATLKVFPKPEATTTLKAYMPSIEEGYAKLTQLACSPSELSCLELQADGTLLLRFGGMRAAAQTRVMRLQQMLNCDTDVLVNEADVAFWKALREFQWLPEGSHLIKVALSPRKLLTLDQALSELPTPPTKHYGVGGHVAWLGLPLGTDITPLHTLLSTMELPGMVISGPCSQPKLGHHTGARFAERLRMALDPQKLFAKGIYATSDIHS